MDQPTEQIPAANIARADEDRLCGRWDRGRAAEGAMGPAAVVVLDIDAERPIERPPPLNERPVEALGPDRLDHPIGVGVGVRGPDRGPAAELDEDEDVQRPELGDLDGEEVARADVIRLGIAGARYVEVPGIDNLMWAGDQAAVVTEIEMFLTGARSARTSDRRLATDIVDSTRPATELGDRAWRELLDRHDALARSAVERAGGRLVKTTGDGILATFDGPGRALEAAWEISTAAPKLHLQVRAGLHAGEIEVTAGDVVGLAVHLAARVAAIAGSDEILVSSTVRELVVGSGFRFADRGSRVLKGIPGRWRLYAVEFARP